jgi:hypothetical protein
VEVLLRDLADAGDFADIERREKSCLAAGQDPEDAVRLGLVGGNFGYEARGGDADGAVEARALLHALVEQVGGTQRRTVQAPGARHIEVGFVNRRHFDERGEGLEDLADLMRALAVAVGVAFDEDGLRAEFVGCAQRHGGMDAELAGGVRSGGDDAALVGAAADHDGLAAERGVV